MTLHLIDANVLIRAHEDYYPIDRIPQFWEWLQQMAEQGAVKMPLQIYSEVAPYRGLLPDWLKQPEVRKAIVLAETANLGTCRRCSPMAMPLTSPTWKPRQSARTRSSSRPR